MPRKLVFAAMLSAAALAAAMPAMASAQPYPPDPDDQAYPFPNASDQGGGYDNRDDDRSYYGDRGYTGVHDDQAYYGDRDDGYDWRQRPDQDDEDDDE